jgi:mono/diheme cytochrome c family protein
MLKFVALAALLTLSVFAQTREKKSPAKDSDPSGSAKGPLPFTVQSIARGKQFYLVLCVSCHDQDGKGMGRRDFNGTQPADLTDPDSWLHGTTAQAIFSTVRDGAKDDMPPFKDRLTDEQSWHVVNYVRSLWPESKRPKMETVADPK